MSRSGPPQVALPHGRLRGKCPDTARFHHQRSEKTRQQSLGFLDPQLEHAETCSTAEATRRHHASVHAAVCGMKLAELAITTEPRGLTASQSRHADILTTAAVPGRSAAQDVCVASSIGAAARGDAAQAAFDRKLSHYTHEVGELRRQNVQYRPLVWTANGRHLSAKTLQRGTSGSSLASSTGLCTTGDTSMLLTEGPATTTSTTLRLTQPHLTTTSSPRRAARVNLCL